jgi:hypothetical protein
MTQRIRSVLLRLEIPQSPGSFRFSEAAFFRAGPNRSALAATPRCRAGMFGAAETKKFLIDPGSKRRSRASFPERGWSGIRLFTCTFEKHAERN